MSGTRLITLYFCTRCSACCRWPGYVRVKDQEIKAIADFLKLAPDLFIARYTRLTDDRRSLSLTEKEDGSCIFLSDKGQCAIQAVKPVQCREFPTSWTVPDAYAHRCQTLKMHGKLTRILTKETAAIRCYSSDSKDKTANLFSKGING